MERERERKKCKKENERGERERESKNDKCIYQYVDPKFKLNVCKFIATLTFN